MTNRRQFIQSGLVFSTLPFTEFAAMNMAVASPEGPDLTLENFVADRRYAQSMSVASKLGRQGVPVVEISGDLTDLWVNNYSRKWKRAPMTLAGVTGQDALFVLETLAPDFGMRVVHKQALDSPSLPTADDKVQVYSWIIAPKNFANVMTQDF
ncbi:hypothetical protein N8600_11300 [Gammaproteobacteria bacterium]|jgi:hypothetical protein|nr:hypothetical protein [Gammaproteobacteria bacterium]